jgi:hypothetical protein
MLNRDDNPEHDLPFDAVREAERIVRLAQAEQQNRAEEDRFQALCERLAELGGAEARPLVTELENLAIHVHAVGGEDRVLRIADDVLRAAGRWDLLVTIYGQTVGNEEDAPLSAVDFYYLLWEA